MSRFIRRTPRRLAASMLAFLLSGPGAVLASEQIDPYGSIPCEWDWINRSRFDSVSSLDWLKYLESKAERGVLGAQLRLSYVRKTRDGKWTAPADNSYALHWLEKAKAQGSKTAEWRIAYYTKGTTHEAYLRSMMAAAEEDGNPWAATTLMNFTNGRFGQKRKPTQCSPEYTPDKKCAPDELLTIDTARKWAEIAAEGGNAQAQEWLCIAAANGMPERGQPKDDNAALKWCRLASYNSCAYWAPSYLDSTVEKTAEEQSLKDATKEFVRKLNSQPWRIPSGGFFTPRDE